MKIKWRTKLLELTTTTLAPRALRFPTAFFPDFFSLFGSLRSLRFYSLSTLSVAGAGVPITSSRSISDLLSSPGILRFFFSLSPRIWWYYRRGNDRSISFQSFEIDSQSRSYGILIPISGSDLIENWSKRTNYIQITHLRTPIEQIGFEASFFMIRDVSLS